MEFLNNKNQKYHAKMIKRSMRRMGPYKIRNLVLNYNETNVKTAKIKTEKVLLDYCGLADEYYQNLSFIMLAKKFTQTFLFKKRYIGIYCSINWTITRIVDLLPNKIISHKPNDEYVFIMSPNLLEYLKISVGDKLRI